MFDHITLIADCVCYKSCNTRNELLALDSDLLKWARIKVLTECFLECDQLISIDY